VNITVKNKKQKRDGASKRQRVPPVLIKQ